MSAAPDDVAQALQALASEVDALRHQTNRAAQAITGEVVHSSTVSRMWAVGGALAVLIAFGIYLGGYKRQVDDVLERVPVLERASQDQDARIRELERHHRQGRASQPTPLPSQGIASGAY